MKRVKHIDARLARWARWCEGGGRLCIAPFARGMRVDNANGVDDAPMVHAQEIETDDLVRLLAFGEQALLVAIYRGRFELLELATGKRVAVGRPLHRIGKMLGVGIEAIRGQICRIDRALLAMIHARRRGEDPRTGLRRPSARKATIIRARVAGQIISIASIPPEN